MKKYLLIFLSLFLFSACTQSPSETTSTNETTQVNSEITTSTQTIENNTINLESPKEYIFGEDLETGTYLLTIDYKSKENQYVFVEINNSTNTCSSQFRNLSDDYFVSKEVSFGEGAKLVTNGDGAEVLSLTFLNSNIADDESDSCISL